LSFQNSLFISWTTLPETWVLIPVLFRFWIASSQTFVHVSPLFIRNKATL
jgi:hypothetical protein